MSTPAAHAADSGAALPTGNAPAPPAAPAAHAPPPAPVLGAAQGSAPPAPRDSKAPRRRLQAPHVGGISGLPPILELSSNLEMSTERQDILSSLVPDATMYFTMVGVMDERMVQTDRFTRGNHSWLPAVSHVYFAIIWLWQVMRVSRESGTASHDVVQFLQVCEQLFDFRSLLVPGPLVPFLTALATCSGPYEWFGDISVTLPPLKSMRITRTTGFTIDQQWLRSVPNPAVAIDLLIDFATRNANNFGNFGSWSSHLFSVNTLTGTDARQANRMSPMFAAPLVIPETIYNNARNYWSPRAAWLPARYTQGSNSIDTWGKFFGFAGSDNVDNYRWFTAITTCMQTYCTYFRGSVPLQSIPITGLGACIPMAIPVRNSDVINFLYPDSYPSADDAQLGRGYPATTKFVLRHFDPNLGQLPEQYSMVTMVNVNLSSLAAPDDSNWSDIRHASIYFGPVWELPVVRSSGQIRTDFGFGQIVSSRYHSSTSLTVS